MCQLNHFYWNVSLLLLWIKGTCPVYVYCVTCLYRVNCKTPFSCSGVRVLKNIEVEFEKGKFVIKPQL